MRLAEARLCLDPPPTALPPPPREIEPRAVLRGSGLPGLPPLPGGTPRRGAVLVLLYPDDEGEARLPLTERPTGNLRHSGEISLPGGAVEPGESNVDAALREAAEEIGLDPDQAGVEVVGEVGEVHVRVSGFALVPVLAFAVRAPELRPDPREVAAIVHAPLDAFVPGAPIEEVEEERDGFLLRYGAFPVAGYRVWGATARILGGLGVALTMARRSG